MRVLFGNWGDASFADPRTSLPIAPNIVLPNLVWAELPTIYASDVRIDTKERLSGDYIEFNFTLLTPIRSETFGNNMIFDFGNYDREPITENGRVLFMFNQHDVAIENADVTFNFNPRCHFEVLTGAS